MTSNQTTNDIDALLRRVDPHCEFCGFIDAVDCARYHRALTALVAERDALRDENAAQTYEGNSVRYWHDKARAYGGAIGSLWEILESAAVHPDGERTITAVLTDLIAERDSLRADLAAAIKQRDEARREWCYMESCKRNEYGMEPADEPSIAAERGWDCFAQQDGGGA